MIEEHSEKCSCGNLEGVHLQKTEFLSGDARNVVFYFCSIGCTSSIEDVRVPLVEFMFLAFTRMPGESYRRRLEFLFCLCDAFWELINSLVCWFDSIGFRTQLLKIFIVEVTLVTKTES